MRWLPRLLLAAYALDRVLRLLAVERFLRHAATPTPPAWPAVSLVQPVTRGASNLAENLRARLRLRYGGEVRHVLVCDATDAESLYLCRAIMSGRPDARVVRVAPGHGAIASKTEKMAAGAASADGEIIVFVDDDLGLRPDALEHLVGGLMRPGIGATFGVACYGSWTTVWSSLMSAFVNTNALLTYIPGVYLTEPYTITGHCFALRRATFEAVGGVSGLARRVDDDHELARRVRKVGLRLAQTAMVYDVTNDLPTARAYLAQMKRWLVFPRQSMLPFLTPHERLVTTALGLGSAVPSALAVLALFSRGRTSRRALVGALAIMLATQALCERRYLCRHTPLHRVWTLLATTLLTPAHVVAILLGGSVVSWRGQRIRVRRGGAFEVLSERSHA